MTKNEIGWHGAYVVGVTPFTKDGSIDMSAFEKCIEYYLDAGVHGIILGGHNGESCALEGEEFVQLTKRAKAVAKQRIPILVGLQAVRPETIVQLANACSESGADGLMLEPPYVLTSSTDAELFARFEIVDKGVNMPIMVYNNPRRTQINLSPQLVYRLAQLEKVVALKDASSDFRHISEMVRVCGGVVSVFVGPGETIFPGLAIGADGFITSGAVELFGKRGAGFYQTVVDGNYKEAVEMHFLLSSLYSKLFSLGTWPAAMKAAMRMLGIPAGYPRSPVLDITDSEKETLKTSLHELNLL